jgi:8-oxo-dGTP pyrophosphatase MutT (NUDIX family)
MMASDFSPVSQAAVLAWKDGLICLIMSSSGKQWIIPKGHIEADETPAATALREAWEEAGLVGSLAQEPLGMYGYEKAGRTYEVTVFFMDVLEIAPHWPEAHRRPRRWLHPMQAIAAVGSAPLREFVRAAVDGPIRQIQLTPPALCG